MLLWQRRMTGGYLEQTVIHEVDLCLRTSRGGNLMEELHFRGWMGCRVKLLKVEGKILHDSWLSKDNHHKKIGCHMLICLPWWCSLFPRCFRTLPLGGWNASLSGRRRRARSFLAYSTSVAFGSSAPNCNNSLVFFRFFEAPLGCQLHQQPKVTLEWQMVLSLRSSTRSESNSPQRFMLSTSERTMSI